MGLFDFWRNNDTPLNNDVNANTERSLPEIKEELFTEKEIPKQNSMETNQSSATQNDINVLYEFLERNLEQQGYEDALLNPDSSHMNQNIENIKIQLEIIISKVKTYYSNYVRTINFHIESRKRNGMVDTVDELISQKDNAEEEIKTVLQVETDSKSNTGLSQNLIMSYTKGFRNGLASISYNTVLKNR